jgi:hypothetical protein
MGVWKMAARRAGTAILAAAGEAQPHAMHGAASLPRAIAQRSENRTKKGPPAHPPRPLPERGMRPAPPFIPL